MTHGCASIRVDGWGVDDVRRPERGIVPVLGGTGSDGEEAIRMDMDMSMGAVGFLITLVYVAVTVLVLAILIIGLAVLIKVNRLLGDRLKAQKAADRTRSFAHLVPTDSAHTGTSAHQHATPAASQATAHIPPAPRTSPAHQPTPQAPDAAEEIRD